MWLGCEWRHAWKLWAGNFGDFWKNMLVEIWLWARPVQLGATGCAVRLLGQLVEIWLWAGQSSWVLTEERCRNSQHNKNCVSLSCRKTKLKKLINVLYLNYRESSVFRGFPCIWIFNISYFDYATQTPSKLLYYWYRQEYWEESWRHEEICGH